MYKKLTNKEWEEAVNLYYKENKDISIKDYCIKNNLNKGQFFYHKRRKYLYLLVKQFLLIL